MAIVLHFDIALPATYKSLVYVWLEFLNSPCGVCICLLENVRIYKDLKLIGFIFGQLLHIFRPNSK
jgi:hypothetical protein